MSNIVLKKNQVNNSVIPYLQDAISKLNSAYNKLNQLDIPSDFNQKTYLHNVKNNIDGMRKKLTGYTNNIKNLVIKINNIENKNQNFSNVNNSYKTKTINTTTKSNNFTKPFVNRAFAEQNKMTSTKSNQNGFSFKSIIDNIKNPNKLKENIQSGFSYLSNYINQIGVISLILIGALKSGESVKSTIIFSKKKDYINNMSINITKTINENSNIKENNNVKNNKDNNTFVKPNLISDVFINRAFNEQNNKKELKIKNIDIKKSVFGEINQQELLKLESKAQNFYNNNNNSQFISKIMNENSFDLNSLKYDDEMYNYYNELTEEHKDFLDFGDEYKTTFLTGNNIYTMSGYQKISSYAKKTVSSNGTIHYTKSRFDKIIDPEGNIIIIDNDNNFRYVCTKDGLLQGYRNSTNQLLYEQKGNHYIHYLYDKNGYLESKDYYTNDSRDYVHYFYPNGSLKEIKKYTNLDTSPQSILKLYENGNIESTAEYPYSFDNLGNIKEIKLSDGEKIEYSYENNNIKLTKKDSEEYQILDKDKNVLEQKFSDGRIENYDKEGNITKIVYKDGTQKTNGSDGFIYVKQPYNIKSEEAQKLVSDLTEKFKDDYSFVNSLSETNYNGSLNQCTEVYDKNNNLQYIKLSREKSKENSKNYAIIYSDGKCDFVEYQESSTNSYHTTTKYNADGSKQVTQIIDKTDGFYNYKKVESSYNSNNKLTLEKIDGRISKKLIGDKLYRYDSLNRNDYIEYKDGSNCYIHYYDNTNIIKDIEYSDGSYKSFYESGNLATEYVPGGINKHYDDI